MNSGQRTTYPAQRGILGGFFAVKQQEGDPGLNRPLRGGVVASEEHEVGGHADHSEKERRVRPARDVNVALCAWGWFRGRMPLRQRQDASATTLACVERRCGDEDVFAKEERTQREQAPRTPNGRRCCRVWGFWVWRRFGGSARQSVPQAATSSTMADAHNLVRASMAIGCDAREVLKRWAAPPMNEMKGASRRPGLEVGLLGPGARCDTIGEADLPAKISFRRVS